MRLVRLAAAPRLACALIVDRPGWPLVAAVLRQRIAVGGLSAAALGRHRALARAEGRCNRDRRRGRQHKPRKKATLRHPGLLNWIPVATRARPGLIRSALQRFPHLDVALGRPDARMRDALRLVVGPGDAERHAVLED